MKTDPLDAISEAIYNAKEFPHAASHYVSTALAWRKTLGAFNNVISTYARREIIRNILFLHYKNPHGNPDDGASFERLLNICLQRDLCGSRVLRTVLTLAKRYGSDIKAW